MIALLSLSKIQKPNKGKDCNLVIEGVACVTTGSRENGLCLSIRSWPGGASVLIGTWGPLLAADSNGQGLGGSASY